MPVSSFILMQQGRPSKAVVIVRQSGGTCTEDRTAVSAGDALTMSMAAYQQRLLDLAVVSSAVELVPSTFSSSLTLLGEPWQRMTSLRL